MEWSKIGAALLSASAYNHEIEIKGSVLDIHKNNQPLYYTND
ncbi:MAG: hypothetical protein WA364_30820 [Candidatus Nitrosopolaris sp.]